MPTNKGRRDHGGILGNSLADLKRLRKEAEKAAAKSEAEAVARKRAVGKPAHQVPRRQRSAAVALSPEDAALFQRAVKSVTRLKDSKRAVLPPVPLAPRSLLAQRRARASGDEHPPPPKVSDHYSPPGIDQDDSFFLSPDSGPDLLKDLRRGKWPIGATLDLHGSTLDEARERLDRFLHSCQQHDIRCVRIVHGKGYGSKDGESVLRQTIRRWLSQFASVQAYVECAEQDGGAGALQVLLRK
jgi:DNA-nicking Smr family endonuclease